MKRSQKDFSKQDEIGIGHLMTDWFAGHPQQSQIESPVLPNSPEIKSYMDFLWPLAESYYAPVPGVFLIQVLSLELLNSKPVWMVRDGLLPLLWFFRRFPKPINLSSKLLIPENLLPFIPDPWTPFVGSYLVKSTTKSNVNRKLLFVGCLSEFFMPLNELPTWFEKTFATDSLEKIKSLEKTVFLPMRQWHFQSENDHFYHLVFAKRFFDAVGENFEALNYRQLVQIESTTGFEVINVGTNFLISDSGLTHRLLAKGASIYGQSEAPQSETSEFVAFSPHHGISVEFEPKIESIGKAWQKSCGEYEKFQLLMSKAFRSDANIKLPWPSWFADWAKTAVQQVSAPQKKTKK